jgi:endonuclease YncB( thermonuclease family)
MIDGDAVMKRALLALVFTLAVLPRAQARAATCCDYSNQRDAQLAADTRDADGDGISCEALPCPCLKPGESSAQRPTALPTPRPRPQPRPRPRKRALIYRRAPITSVADGDTITVRLANGAFTRVRRLGIDAPETKDPDKSVECGGAEATDNMLPLSFTEPHDTDCDGILDDEDGIGPAGDAAQRSDAGHARSIRTPRRVSHDERRTQSLR